MLTPSEIVKTICTTTDELLRRVVNWIQDEQFNPIVPDQIAAYITGLDQMVFEAGQQLPESCGPLKIAAGRLHEEYRAYKAREFGKVRSENGAPCPAFWDAMKNVAMARDGADTPLVEKLEPVYLLLQQGVSHTQIALSIYGRRYGNGHIGPFVRKSDGAADSALIEQEAKTPGSVIPDNWVPPWQNDAQNARKEKLAGIINAFKKLEVKKYEDPGTVESMLRDGCYIQQIERGKSVSRDEVLRVAAEIGVTPVDQPGYQPQSISLPSLPALDGDDDGEDGLGGEGSDGSTAIRDLIIEMHQNNQDMGSAEIAAALRAKNHDVNTQKVSATLRHWKSRVRTQDSNSTSA